MSLSLSVLDLTPVPSGSTGAEALENTIDLARHAERLGYSRVWLAEHHNLPSVASSAPEIMIGQIGRATSTIRIGSGGVMLPNHAPLKVVEWFRVLEGLFPGRVDLGIGRAPGTDQMTALALRRSREAVVGDDFPAQLAELLAYDSGSFPPNHPFGSIIAMPQDIALPPIFLLGSSNYSAHYAAAIGVGFAFAHHINNRDAAEVMKTYRADFQPSPPFEKPHAILATSVLCAETDEEADKLAASMDLSFLRIQRNERGQLPSLEEAAAYQPTLEEQARIRTNRERFAIGSPETVKARILELAEETQADEVMLTTSVHSHAARVRSYELIAEAFGLV
ncbi:MAG: LLM class flavin-dependent oxidoreductase [Thermomicrobiales bacterium]|nr:LLM class flavin-dependent oxidoreductase [Thermomicrobiales bacterium]